jgi:hypothetical protein
MTDCFPGRTEVNLKNRWARINRAKVKGDSLPLPERDEITTVARDPRISFPSILTLLQVPPRAPTNFLHLALNLGTGS